MFGKISISDLFNKLNQHKKIFVWLFFLVYLIVGFSIYKDYGISWDESFSRENGKVALNYVLHNDMKLFSYSERDYGTAFEMPIALFENYFSFSSEQFFFFKHLITFLVFFFSVFIFYLLCLKRFKNVWFSLLGPLFIILSPRIFAESFYNSKDLVVLSFFIFSIYTLINLLEKPNLKNTIIHAIFTALLVDIRLPGLFAVTFTVLLFVLDSVLVDKMIDKKKISFLLLYILLSIGLITLFWPFLWQHSLDHFLETFSVMGHWSREAGTQLLYFGRYIFADILPWHYIPVWIIITTPILYIILFCLGLWTSIKKFFKNGLNYYRHSKLDFIFLGWFFGPLLTVIIIKSILYDGWRHLYFIYPAFIYIGLVGLETIILFLKERLGLLKKYIFVILGVILSTNFIVISSFMIRNHPYQNLYFNFLVGGEKSARKNFDLDYWGLTFRRGLEYIANHDTDQSIPIFFAYMHPDSINILAPEIKSRFKVLNSADGAKYVLSTYRWQTYDKLPHDKKFYVIKVDGAEVMTVFKMY